MKPTRRALHQIANEKRDSTALGHRRRIQHALGRVYAPDTPELLADINDGGIVLAGGGALVRGFQDRLRRETGLAAHLVEEPLTCVAVGAGRCLVELEAALPVLPPLWLASFLLAAAVSDILDGRLARARNEATRLGFWLDGTVDGLVAGVAAAALAHAGRLPWWAAALVLLRLALPWLSVPIWFARAQIPGMGSYVSGRLPGGVLLAGLVGAALAVPGAGLMAAAGAVGGIGTFAATVRAYTNPRPPRAWAMRTPDLRGR